MKLQSSGRAGIERRRTEMLDWLHIELMRAISKSDTLFRITVALYDTLGLLSFVGWTECYEPGEDRGSVDVY